MDIYQKCRGEKKVRGALIEAMRQELRTTFKEEFEKQEVYLLAASSCSPDVAAGWVEQIKEEFPGMDVLYDNLTCGLACHSGPDGLGIGCACRPIKKKMDALK
ncbi:MAG: hypothetical protein ACI4EI_04700 [Muricoprocola sp.]